MTTFTSPLIVKPLDTSYTIQSDATVAAAFRGGAIAVVSGDGAGTSIKTITSTPTILTTVRTSTVRCRGYIRFVVDGTTAVVPFYYTNA